MAFQWFTIVFGWAAFFFFVVLAAYKIHRFATMPLNLRWKSTPYPMKLETSAFTAAPTWRKWTG